MSPDLKPVILLIGRDSALIYLFGRFAEQSGYMLAERTENISLEQIEAAKPAIIIFLSTQVLEKNQALVTELSNHDSPILVCTSTAEELKTRELGADYCLFHPLTYKDFQTALEMVAASKRVNPAQ